jgi:hypothetical protein
MTTTVSQCEYLFCVIPENKPDLFPERHWHIKIGQECPDTRATALMFHHLLSPINGSTLSI